MTSIDDNKWGWAATEIKALDGAGSWPGYTMHSSAQPKVPESLCRWGIYKAGSFMVVIALNGRIFGYDRSGLALKAQGKVERLVAAMGHEPVRIPVDTKARSRKHD